MKEKIFFIASMIIFGAVGVFAKYIHLSAPVIAFCLSLIGSICLALIVGCRKKKVDAAQIKVNLWPLVGAAAALCGNWIFLFQAYKATTIANAALSYYFAPVLVIILSPFVLKERLSLRKAASIGASLCGLFLILQGASSEGGSNLVGIGYGLTAAGFYAALTFINKFIHVDGMVNTLAQLSLSVLMLGAFILATDGIPGGSISRTDMTLLMLLGVVHGGLGFYLFFTGMEKLEGQLIAVLSYIDPLTSLIISALVLHEELTLQQVAGAAVLFISIWAGQRNRG